MSVGGAELDGDVDDLSPHPPGPSEGRVHTVSNVLSTVRTSAVVGEGKAAVAVPAGGGGSCFQAVSGPAITSSVSAPEESDCKTKSPSPVAGPNDVIRSEAATSGLGKRASTDRAGGVVPGRGQGRAGAAGQGQQGDEALACRAQREHLDRVAIE